MIRMPKLAMNMPHDSRELGRMEFSVGTVGLPHAKDRGVSDPITSGIVTARGTE